MSKSLHITASELGGMGVCSTKPIAKGETILTFAGKKLHEKDLPFPYDEVTDHYMQIGIDLYLGPSGKIDDFVNHSCNPNSGVVITSGKVFLVAIKNIQKGEEITWDYSTTMKNDDWTMMCQCGAKNCRKIIKEFKFLPKERKLFYQKTGIIPQYITQ